MNANLANGISIDVAVAAVLSEIDSLSKEK